MATNLARIGRAQADVGLADDARATLRRAVAALPDRPPVGLPLRPVIRMPGPNAGEPPGPELEARMAAQQRIMRDFDAIGEILDSLAEIAQDQARVRAPDDARATADRAVGLAGQTLKALGEMGNAREFHAPKIAVTLAAAGDLNAAFGWADGSMTEGSIVGAIALSASKSLDREAARRFVDAAAARLTPPGKANPIRDFVNIGLADLAEAQARVGDIEGARRSARAIGVGPNRGRFDMTPERATALQRAAGARRDAGDLAGARALLLDSFRLVDEHAPWRGRDGVYRQAIAAQLDADDLAGALRSVAAMAEPDPDLLATIARAQAAAGQDEIARASFRRAITAASRAVETARADTERLVEAGAFGFTVAHAVGEEPQVPPDDVPLPILELPANLTREGTKSSTRSVQAEVQAMAGDVAAAVAARRSIRDTYFRDYSLQRIVAARATAGDVAGALDLALGEAKGPGERRMALVGLAEGVAARLGTPALDSKPAR